MNLGKLWIADPNKHNAKSVTLTILVLSLIILVVVGILQVFDIVNNTGPFTELLYSSFALYFGRRFSVKGSLFGPEEAKQIEEKVKDNG